MASQITTLYNRNEQKSFSNRTHRTSWRMVSTPVGQNQKSRGCSGHRLTKLDNCLSLKIWSLVWWILIFSWDLQMAAQIHGGVRAKNYPMASKYDDATCHKARVVSNWFRGHDSEFSWQICKKYVMQSCQHGSQSLVESVAWRFEVVFIE